MFGVPIDWTDVDYARSPIGGIAICWDVFPYTSIMASNRLPSIGIGGRDYLPRVGTRK